MLQHLSVFISCLNFICLSTLIYIMIIYLLFIFMIILIFMYLDALQFIIYNVFEVFICNFIDYALFIYSWLARVLWDGYVLFGKIAMKTVLLLFTVL